MKTFDVWCALHDGRYGARSIAAASADDAIAAAIAADTDDLIAYVDHAEEAPAD